MKLHSTLDLRALKVFLTVTACGNMSTAAQRLGITQSAVSQSITKLESELATLLVDRSTRPLHVTAAGALLSRRAAALIEEFEVLSSLVRETGSEKPPDIRLGLVDSFAATIGPKLISGLLGSTAQLAVWSGLAAAHGTALLNRDLDIIITTDQVEDADGLERHPLLTEPLLLLLPNSMIADTPPTLERLAATSPLVRYSARSHLGMQIERYLRRMGVSPQRRLEVDTSDTLIAMVASNVGWGITTPLCFLQGRAFVAGVKAVRAPGPAFNRHITLVARAGEYARMKTRLVELARTILRNEFLPEIRALIPWLAHEVVVGED